jgi:hypothetical protein
MAATELLDFNQIQETSSLSGDTPSDGGGLMTWNFRCDPNLAWDPSQTFFAMELEIDTKTKTGSADGYTEWQPAYKPDVKDFYPFFAQRAFSSMSHVVDGVTIAHSNQPYADKIMQEKYLHDLSLSNQANFESLMLARAIDDGHPDHNLFMCDIPDSNRIKFGYDMIHDMDKYGNSARNITTPGGKRTDTSIHTVYFQPPFDLWTKHDRISGGNHMIQLNLKAADTSGSYWGQYMVTPQAGFTGYTIGSEAFTGAHIGLSAFDIDGWNAGAYGGYGGQLDKIVPSMGTRGMGGYRDNLADVSLTDLSVTETGVVGTTEGILVANVDGSTYPIRAENYAFYGDAGKGIRVKIKTLRLLRRVVRFTIERPIGMEDFNCTEMAFFSGTPISLATTTSTFASGQMTQNFLLPASTFGLAFYWRDSSNSYYDVVDDFKTITRKNEWTQYPSATTVAGYRAKVEETKITRKELQLSEFYFTYGGETYPAQRINNMYNGSTTMGPGSQKLQIMTHMLQGAFNTDMDRYNVSFAGRGLLDRLDGSAFFFPVAKHNNSDNSDLQVSYTASGASVSTPYYAASETYGTLGISLVVVAFYDARIEFAYNAANQLEKVTKTEWK